MKSINFILYTMYFLYVHCLAIPIDLNFNNKSSDQIDFNLILPNNDTVQISLSFNLFKYSNTTDDSLTITNTSTTTTSAPHNGGDDNYPVLPSENDTESPKKDVEEIPEKHLVTVGEAIEGFRQDLINKEREIGGIIESDRVFYRHFKLNFEDDKSINVRCTYDSNYKHRSLKISCYEYYEIEGERILSSGEIEIFRENDLTYKSNITSVDISKMHQAYNMDIS